MKIQLETYNTKYTVETPNDDLDINEYLDIFVGLLKQAGFHNNTINEGIKEFSESQ
jgi:hypothetical protein